MQLLIDVGNSRLKWVAVIGEYDETAITQYGLLAELESYIQSIDTAKTDVLLAAVNQTQELMVLLEGSGFRSVTSVKSQFKQQGIENSYSQPERMGVDRWLGMIAAYRLVADDEGVIVVDAGSAMTIDIVSEQGLHLGGYIVPGLTMAKRALFANTEQVNRYDEALLTEDVPTSDTMKLGNNTLQCVEYGVLNQMLALVKQVAEQFPDFKLIITGGDGELLADFIPALLDKNLVLKGLWQVRK
ncbi:hypothetical protein A9R00_02710 [Oleispira antarctica]|uniref:Type III pantothenate kinase n=1 Tax=Oleispira antarctica TaxID=188908 RepID=A0A1Y5HUV0_OLEAN|nr:hypothetical protein A9R00_02710 [Oleispira antarctica]